MGKAIMGICVSGRIMEMTYLGFLIISTNNAPELDYIAGGRE